MRFDTLSVELRHSQKSEFDPDGEMVKYFF
jgi:hypothetical protein